LDLWRQKVEAVTEFGANTPAAIVGSTGIDTSLAARSMDIGGAWRLIRSVRMLPTLAKIASTGARDSAIAFWKR
jgi:hypothetical protein